MGCGEEGGNELPEMEHGVMAAEAAEEEDLVAGRFGGERCLGHQQDSQD
jgi:hypothetical protein